MTDDRRWRRRVLVWVALPMLAAAVVCWVVSGRLLTPERRTPSRSGSASLEDVELLTSDGLRLAAWVREPEGFPRGTVLLFHGKHGCRQASRLTFAAKRGFRGLAVDARAHGASEGEWTTFGWDERHDVAAAVAYAKERWPDEPLIAWGTSQGAAAVLYFAEEVEEERVFDGLILESLYVDIDTAFRNRVSHQVGEWAQPLGWPVRQFVSMRAGIDPERMAPVRVLRRLTAEAGAGGRGTLARVPILIATGMDDAYSTPAEAEQLQAAAAPGQAELVLVPGRGHEDLLSGGAAVHETAVGGFLARFR